MSRLQRMSLVLWIACKKVELQSGLAVFNQWRNRCVGKLRADAVQPFLVQFTKAKHARLEQEKILLFSNDISVLKIDRQMTLQCL